MNSLMRRTVHHRMCPRPQDASTASYLGGVTHPYPLVKHRLATHKRHGDLEILKIRRHLRRIQQVGRAFTHSVAVDSFCQPRSEGNWVNKERHS